MRPSSSRTPEQPLQRARPPRYGAAWAPAQNPTRRSSSAAFEPSGLAALPGSVDRGTAQRLRGLLPPAPVRRADFFGIDEEPLIEHMVRLGLIELWEASSGVEQDDEVHLTPAGREVARALRPATADYQVQRGCGAPRHPCDACGSASTAHSVRVSRPGLLASPVVEAHYFCWVHRAEAEEAYRSLRAVYVSEPDSESMSQPMAGRAFTARTQGRAW